LIEICIKNAIRQSRQTKPFSLNISVDKATRDVSGTPDITDSIFIKINKCNAFIADISIINCDYEKKKTPNPNVLLELGYAARTLGWERIICICNIDFGGLNELPFDLRNRRIIKYSLTGKDRNEVKKSLSSEIYNSIMQMYQQGILIDKVFDFLKKDIDTEILSLLNHFIKIFILDKSKSNMFDNINEFLNYRISDLEKILNDRMILGFYIYKVFDEHEKRFNEFINRAISSHYYQREVLNSFIDIYEWFGVYRNIQERYFEKLFVKRNENNNVFVMKGNGNYPNRCLLMQKVDDKKALVLNFGDFAYGNIKDLTHYYSFNKDYIIKYLNVVFQLIILINNWLDITNDEFIMDFVKNFRVKKTDGEWL
jgi:hypothetical protein